MTGRRKITVGNPPGKIKLAYITFDGRIPSRSANSVGVMKMCSHLAATVTPTILVIPGSQGMALDKLGHVGDLMGFYSINTPFDICRLANPFGKLSLFRLPYSLFMVRRAVALGAGQVLTRNIEVAFWALLFNLPVTFESHNFTKFKRNFMARAWIRATQDKTKKVSMIVTTYASKNSFARLGIPNDRVKVLPNGTEPKFFSGLPPVSNLRSQLGLPLLSTIITYSGSLRHGKGIDEFLSAAGMLPGHQFLIIGGTPEDVDRYEAMARVLNIANVLFTGHLPQEKARRYISASDILVLPNTTKATAHSSDYTSPMKLFEYLAAGKAIVATDFPVFREILSDRYNAILVKPDSAKAIAEGISQLIAEPDMAARVAEHARQDAIKYSWDNRAVEAIQWMQLHRCAS